MQIVSTFNLVIYSSYKSTLTLYEQEFFGGEETITDKDKSELSSGEDNNRYSAIVTGCDAWTIYKWEFCQYLFKHY